MAKIFISYRREDSKHAVGRLHAALKRHVRNPRRDIFIDIDNIPRGVDFVDHLDGQVAQCDVMLAVIGPHWVTQQDPKTRRRRLDDPNDFVRIEIASALKRGIPVVPVVLDDTPIPAAADLPEDLKLLARRNGERLEHESFDSDVERLIRNLPERPRPASRPIMTTPPARSGPPKWIGLAAAVGVLALAGGAWAVLANGGGRPPAPQAAEADREAERIETEGAAAPRNAAEAAFMSAALGGPLAKREFRDTFADGKEGPAMMAIPAGEFIMGSPASEAGRSDDEGPQRRVTVPAFAAGKFEVTWAEWDLCVAAGVCASLAVDGFGGGTRPVTNVSWDEASAYAKWLSNRTGQTYRLLSEAEWEYAARAGSPSRWGFGDSESSLGSHAWYSSNSGFMTHAVGTKSPNEFGLHDMHGNVWEWVEDCYEDSYSAKHPSNGAAYKSGSCSYRVDRGGSWISYPLNLRSAIRLRYVPAGRGDVLGFRVARTLSSTP